MAEKKGLTKGLIQGLRMVQGSSEMKGIIWPRYLGKVIAVRDSTGTEYEGTLKSWNDEVITLESDSSEIIVRRKGIVSVRGPKREPKTS